MLKYLQTQKERNDCMKRKACVIIMLLTLIIIIINISFVVHDSFFYNLDNLPKGTFIREDFDQNILFSSGYKLKLYQIEANNQHPAAVRAELCNDKTGESQTIYWQIGTQSTVVSWSDENPSVVIINDVPIDFSKSTYDCRDYENFTYSKPFIYN